MKLRVIEKTPRQDGGGGTLRNELGLSAAILESVLAKVGTAFLEGKTDWAEIS